MKAISSPSSAKTEPSRDPIDDGRISPCRAMLRRRARQIREEFSKVVAHGVREGSLRGLNPDVVSRAILGAVRVVSMSEESPVDGPGSDILIDLLLNGLAERAGATQG